MLTEPPVQDLVHLRGLRRSILVERELKPA